MRFTCHWPCKPEHKKLKVVKKKNCEGKSAVCRRTPCSKICSLSKHKQPLGHHVIPFILHSRLALVTTSPALFLHWDWTEKSPHSLKIHTPTSHWANSLSITRTRILSRMWLHQPAVALKGGLALFQPPKQCASLAHPLSVKPAHARWRVTARRWRKKVPDGESCGGCVIGGMWRREANQRGDADKRRCDWSRFAKCNLWLDVRAVTHV